MPNKWKPTHKIVHNSDALDVFFMYSINKDGTESASEIKVIEINEGRASECSATSATSEPSAYPKHTNLEVQPLSLFEKFRLFCLYYLKLRNIIKYVLVVICMGWFLFNAYNVLADYLENNSNVFLEYANSNLTHPPAVTFCTERLFNS